MPTMEDAIGMAVEECRKSSDAVSVVRRAGQVVITKRVRLDLKSDTVLATVTRLSKHRVNIAYGEGTVSEIRRLDE